MFFCNADATVIHRESDLLAAAPATHHDASRVSIAARVTDEILQNSAQQCRIGLDLQGGRYKAQPQTFLTAGLFKLRGQWFEQFFNRKRFAHRGVSTCIKT